MSFRFGLAALLVICAPAFSGASIENMANCLNHAGRGGDPQLRDRARLQCVRTFAPRLDRTTCLRVSRGFEYSMNSEATKSFCIFELKQNPRVSECMAAARSMDYGSSRDDLVWGCLQRLNSTISQADCRQLTRLMVYPRQKARAASYCSNEIKASR